MNCNLNRHAPRALFGLALVGLSSIALAQGLTRDNGAPVGDNQNSQTAGPGGPVLLQDVQLIQKLQRFSRERVPERVVHARGTGAHGEFVATANISDVTRAKVFTPGTRTPVFVRFSTVVGSRGSSDLARDVRGFATRFYTRQGNFDLWACSLDNGKPGRPLRITTAPGSDIDPVAATDSKGRVWVAWQAWRKPASWA